VGVDLVPLLVEVGLASSKGDARRAIEQGAVTVNATRAQAGRVVRSEDVLHRRFVLLRKGKRNYAILVRT
jgi:tyrosyl-tRNA synthetase